MQIDVATFIQWLDAHMAGKTRVAGFYRARFRSEFQPPFAAWPATWPFSNRQAPPTPFALGRYRLKPNAPAAGLERAAAGASERAKRANQHADDYMLAVVLFALSLFFAGISTKLHGLRGRAAILALGCVVFCLSLIWVATLPVQLTT